MNEKENKQQYKLGLRHITPYFKYGLMVLLEEQLFLVYAISVEGDLILKVNKNSKNIIIINHANLDRIKLCLESRAELSHRSLTN